MSPHVSDQLPGLLAGDLDLGTAAGTLDHARTCPECADALRESVRAHAALVRAARTLGSLRAGDPDGPDEGPPGHDLLPPLAMPARPARRRTVTAAAAAAVLLAGGSAGATYVLSRPAAVPPPAVALSAELRSVAGSTAPATARGTVVMLIPAAGPGTRTMKLTIRGLPPAGRGHFYEVWLLQPATRKMLPVGILPTVAGPATYRLPAAITTGYSAVDISRQADDGNPAHSVDSVLRAQLPA